MKRQLLPPVIIESTKSGSLSPPRNLWHETLAVVINCGVLFQNAISPRIQNRENRKNVVNSVLLYLERSVMDQMKSGIVQ